MRKKGFAKISLALCAALTLSGCGMGKKEELPTTTAETTVETKEETKETVPEETYSPEEMELIKYNYYVDLNNDIVEVIDSIGYYFEVVDYTEEFSLLADTGLTYGYRVYGKNTDILDDCLLLADMEPDYGEMDQLVKEMAEPLREVMDTLSDISRSNDYADNQYQKAKDYHKVLYTSAETVTNLGYEFMDAVAQMGEAKMAEEEEKMKEEGRLIIYNASRGIFIGKEVLNVIYSQGISDENLTELDLTEIKTLHDELVAVVADLDAATADNDQLIKESLANSRPFDGLYDSLISALEWMIKQVESGQPVDLSHSGAPLGSIGHFSETLSKCIDRYNSVFGS